MRFRPPWQVGKSIWREIRDLGLKYPKGPGIFPTHATFMVLYTLGGTLHTISHTPHK